MNRSSLTAGSIFGSLVRFSAPMIIINILQMLFHTVDTAVLGLMSGDAEVAAVGACGSLISMLLCLVTGYSSAANVMAARRIGARDLQGARKVTGAALTMGLLSGTILMVIVLIGSRRFLIMTNCQPEVLDLADRYMKIYFLGMPIYMLYNFAASILRASGDSVRPMFYMILSGVINVGLNILFVGGFHMTVTGVAVATVISNAVALVLALAALAKNKDYCKIEKRYLRLRKQELSEMLRLGIPTCISGLSFYFGEVVVTSAVNSLSANAMTANAVAAQLDRINYTVGSSIAGACAIMIAQNYGAANFDRIKKTARIGSAYCISVTTVIGLLVVLVSEPVIGLLADSPDVVEIAKGRLIILALTNFLTCTMEVFSGAVRALQRPRSLWVVGLVCGFLIRSFWAWFVWPFCKTLPFLFVCFPLSTLVGMGIFFLVYRDAMKKEIAARV